MRILVTLRQKLVSEEILRTTASQKISRGAERLSGLLYEVELSKLKLKDGVNLLKASCRRPLTVSLFLLGHLSHSFDLLQLIFVRRIVP